MPLTPGVQFLIKTGLPVVLGPSLLVHALLILISHISPTVAITPVILACIYLLPFPASIFISSRISRYKDSLAARRLGARPLPHVEGILPGNIDLLYRGLSADKTDYLGELWLHAMKDHGTTFTISVLNDTRMCTLNPKNIQKILATDFETYRKGIMLNRIMEPMLGVGVFNSDGDMWQFHRKMTRPFFSKERVTDLMLYEKKAAIALKKMQERFDTGLAVDFQELVGDFLGCSNLLPICLSFCYLARFTLDAASEFLLGASVNSLDSALPEPYNCPTPQVAVVGTASTRFARAFAAAQITMLRRVELGPLWPLAEIFKDKMKEPMAEINSFIDPIVKSAINKREHGGAKDNDTFLGHLLDVTDDMKIIVDETLNLMLAGRDTTASLLTFVTYCLAMHPEVLSRLREEIISTVGSSRAPSYEELRDMKYLRAVLNETLRLFPPVPFNLRETIGETTWYDDDGGKFYVPPGTRLAFSIMHLQRHEDYWGPDAHIYDPDRWLDSRARTDTSNPSVFVPFNAGPRTCPGRDFAYHEASIFLVQLLQRFDHIELALECQPPNTRPPKSWKDPATQALLGKRRAIEQCFPRAHLTLYADGGLWIRAKQAKLV